MENFCEVRMKKINEYQFMTHLLRQINRSIKVSKAVFSTSTEGHSL